MKDELEAAKEIADETQVKLQEEIRRREEVSVESCLTPVSDAKGTALPLAQCHYAIAISIQIIVFFDWFGDCLMSGKALRKLFSFYLDVCAKVGS